MAKDTLPPIIDTEPQLRPVKRPEGAPDAQSREPAHDVAAQSRPEPARLDFIQTPVRSIALEYPFRLDGEVITNVSVRRLLTSEVANLAKDEQMPDLFEVYSVMTGLPADVLRGLDADDGQKVAEVAYDFLPLLFREVLGSA